MKVSVCLATYNGEKFIYEQLNSILQQLKDQDEIIISDDNSTDRTIEIVKEINDTRIKIYYNKGRKGYTPNFENALNKSTGDIIFLSDQDDIWLLGKYEKVISELLTYDLVVTNSKVTDENLNVTNESFFTIYNSGTGILKNMVCNTYYGSCMAFNKRLLSFALPFPKNKEIGFDLWLGMVGEIIGKVKFIDEAFLLYRRSDFTVTEIGSLLSRSKRSLPMKLYKRLIILTNVFKFAFKYKFNLLNNSK